MIFEAEPREPFPSGAFHLEVLSTLKSGRCPTFKSIVGTCSTAQHARGLGFAAGPFFTGPGDELIGPHQNNRRLIFFPSARYRILDDLQRNMQFSGSLRESWAGIATRQIDQRKPFAELLINVAARGQRLRRQMKA